jgi:hypothetical protein
VGSVLRAIGAAFRDLRERRVLALALLPPLAALLVWGGLTWALADDWSRLAQEWIAGASWLAWAREWGLSRALVWAGGLAAAALLLPLALIAALLVTGIVAMPVIVPLVGERHYPRLERRRGGTFAGSLRNSVAATVVFALLWTATLPLWLTGIGALLLPPLLSAQFNRRLFVYDALAEHASVAEHEAIRRACGGRLYLLGLALALMYYVPVLNLAVPVLSGLAYTHFCLAELARLRQA